MTAREDSPKKPPHVVWRHLGSSSAIYGLLVYASLIAATAAHPDDDDTIGTILTFSLVTLVVFWTAHLYAGTLSHHGNFDAADVTLWESIKHGADESFGMLEAAVIPTIVLVLGAVGVLEPRTSIVWSLIAATVVLGFLGFIAFTLREDRLWVRLVGAVVTALFGVVLIILESSIH